MATDPASTPEPSRRRVVLNSIAYVLAFRVLDRVAGLLSMVILARLLVPAHFGLVALATAVAAFVELLGALSLDAVLIQKKDASRVDFDTAWTIQVGIAWLSASILALAAGPASEFFREPQLELVIYVLAAATLVDGFTNIRIVEFRKMMRFDKEFVFLATRRIATIIITIAAAFLLRNYWALVIGIASGKLIGVVLGYIMRPYRPSFTLQSRQHLLHASAWLFTANGVQFLRLRLSDFVLGRVAGATVLGAFNLANEVSAIVSTELVAPVNRVALPEFSSIGSRDGVARRFGQLTGQVAIFLVPAGVGLSLCAPLLVEILFGPNWSIAGEALRILAIAGMIAGLGSNMGVALLAVGRFRDNAMLHGVGAGLLVPLLLIGALLYTYVGAAFAILTANIVTVLIAAIRLRSALGYPFSDFLACLWRPAVSAGFMAVVLVPLLHLDAWTSVSLSAVVQLAIVVIAGAFAYVASLLSIWLIRGRRDAPEKLTLELIHSAIAKLRSKLRPA